MKLVLCDHRAALNRGIEYEVDRLKKALPGAEIVIHTYEDDEKLIDELKDADGCITAYLKMGEKIFSRCPKLKSISVNASGFNTIDLDAANKYEITVCAIRNYCTEEVAEHTMAIMLSLTRKLKVHEYRLEHDKVWSYKLAGPIYRLSGKTLAIFGFGRIGQAVGKRAQAFGLKVIAVDPYLPPEVAESCGAELVSPEEACERADIITNHMNVMKGAGAYYDHDFFASLKKKPIFLNIGRGISVDEAALLEALDKGWISSAGLDVLAEEQPDPASNPLFGRENVVITPHGAFYSMESLRALQDISCDNLIAMVTGHPENANYIVN